MVAVLPEALKRESCVADKQQVFHGLKNDSIQTSQRSPKTKTIFFFFLFILSSEIYSGVWKNSNNGC
jgi:hypothetical protein